MPSHDRKWTSLVAGVALAVLGSFLIWKGFTTAPGEPAIRVPMREDWSATEAKVIGTVCWVLGIYVAAFLDKPRNS